MFITRYFQLLARKILVTFAIFAIRADFSVPFLAFSLAKSLMLLHLLFLRLLRYLLLGVLASKKNLCYFCEFCDICGLFSRALLGHFLFLSLEFLLFLRYLLLDIFSQQEKSFSLSKSLMFLHLLFLRYLSSVFSRENDLAHSLLVFLASEKNPCYTFASFAAFADFSGPFLAFSLSKS